MVTVNDPAGTPGNRRVTIANLMSAGLLNNPYKFQGYRSAALSLTDAAWNLVACDAEAFDTGGNFDTVTNKGRFTAPVAGFYQFNGRAGAASLPANTLTALALYKNGAQYITASQGYTGGSTADAILHLSECIQLAATDYIELYLYNGGAGLSLKRDGTASFNGFSGFLVSIT